VTWVEELDHPCLKAKKAPGCTLTQNSLAVEPPLPFLWGHAVYVYLHVHTHRYTHMHIHACTHTNTHIYIQKHVHTCTYTHVWIYAYTCT
jgi:hypothetical protein